MPLRRFRMGLLAFFGALGCATYAANASETNPLGLTQEKPRQGRFVSTDRGYMSPYTATIPGTDVTFTMTPIPGGTFLLGSPAGEAKRKEDEGPQVSLTIEPFWMSTCEVTWNEYKKYMALRDAFARFEIAGARQLNDARMADAVTAPSKLYDPGVTFESGDDPQQPAVMMTQYAARQYTKWLSKISGQFYRLPSEAEWEYAARAGSRTAYCFGDDPARLDDYAWYYDNSEDRTHRVAGKQPNAWGLHDMHGNVAEWVLDQYSAHGYSALKDKSSAGKSAIQWPSEPFPLVARGGSWELGAEDCRSASRLASDDDAWKEDDPNLPASPWWHTSSPATGVGFRIIRPLAAPADEPQRARYWDANLVEIEEDVQARLSEQSGALGLVDEALPEAIADLPAR